MMSKKIIGAALISIGIILIMAAFALGGYNLWDDHRAQEKIDDILAQIAPHNTDYSEEAIPDYILNPYMDMPTVEIDGYQYIGTVEIPSLELKLPIMETWSYPHMKISPCRYAGSAYLSNLVICAHNYAAHFGRLKNLQIGDKVVFTDMDGNTFHYAVEEMETLSGTAVEEMQSGKWALTLFTCTFSGQARVTVRCSTDE